MNRPADLTASFAAVLVATLLVCVAAPSPAEAQGWTWIRRLSGPSYTKTVYGRFSLCLGPTAEGGFGITCGETAVVPRASFSPIARNRATGFFRKAELQVGASVTRGIDGDNDDAGIFDTRVWVVEFEGRTTLLDVPVISPLFGIGYGWHTFNGGSIPAKFSRGHMVLTVAARYPTPLSTETLRLGQSDVSVFFESGFRFRRFSTPLSNEDFGATSATGELDRWGSAFYVHVGFRFQRGRNDGQ